MSTLLERLRAAKGNDRALDVEVFLHFRMGGLEVSNPARMAGYVLDGSRNMRPVRHYTDDLNLALMIAETRLPDCRFAMYTDGGGKGPTVLVMRDDEPVLAEERAANLSLALLAAVLVVQNNEPPER